MTLNEARQTARRVLTDAGVPDPEIDADYLVADAAGLSRLEIHLHATQSLLPRQEERFLSLLKARASREPLQYLLGTQCFYGLDFSVDRRVLIPRQETETLCEIGVKALRGISTPRALDLCTGSGAIAVTLKHECPNALVTATDISEDALAVARENARHNRADVHFLLGDLFAPVRGEVFDVLLSNPPYVSRADCERLQPEVCREPRLALDGGEDGLDFYRCIAAEAFAHLAPGGLMALETGDDQAEPVRLLLTQNGRYRDIEIVCDLYGKQRVVIARPASDPT